MIKFGIGFILGLLCGLILCFGSDIKIDKTTVKAYKITIENNDTVYYYSRNRSNEMWK